MRATGTHREYAGLDLLRFVGLMMMLCHHLPHVFHAVFLELPALFQEVTERFWIVIEIFFVISGFLIGDVSYRAFDRAPEKAFKRFYVSRFLKIFPSYFLVLALYLWIKGDSFQSEWLRYAFFVQNFGDMMSFVHSWSLCVEEHFYLMFPLSILALKKPSRLVWLVSALGLTFVFSNVFLWMRAESVFSQRSFFAEPTGSDPWKMMLEGFYFPSFGHFQSFAAGILLALGVRYSTAFRQLIERCSRLLFVAGWAGLCVLAYFANPRTAYWVCVYAIPLSMIFSAMLVASCCVSSAWANQIKVRWLGYASASSYSVYLVHMLVYEGILRYAGSLGISRESPIQIPFALALTFIAGIALYEWFERPIYQLRNRWI
jgi:peptidoglycan/LPS O-acetylase OafA/YrhL